MTVPSTGTPRLARVRTGERTKRIGSCVTGAEYELLHQQALDQGLSFGSYIYLQLAHIAQNGPVVNADGQPAEEQGESSAG